jgi:CRP-like cAMP-binding protein
MPAVALLALADVPLIAEEPTAAEDVLVGCTLFAGLSREQMGRVAALITSRLLESGDVLVREGEMANDLFVIQQGAVEVTKRVAAGEREQRITMLHAGATLGETTLVDRTPRSVTVRAVGPTVVGVLSMEALQRLAADDRRLERQVLRNCTNELSRRLRLTNEATVAAMEQQLELERTRALMGRIVVFMVFLMVTYAFVLKAITTVLPPGTSASATTIPLSFVWGGALYALMRRSHLPCAVFGLTLRGWRPVVREALVWTAMICAGTTILKLALIGTTASFAHERLFDLTGLLDPHPSLAHLRTSLLIGIVYAAVGPLQEFIARSGLQTALRRCLVGRWATVVSIVASNAMFACAHLHLSVSFAIVSFFPGLVWGALFYRQRHIVGVSVSHVLSGWFAFFVVGFEPWY